VKEKVAFYPRNGGLFHRNTHSIGLAIQTELPLSETGRKMVRDVRYYTN